MDIKVENVDHEVHDLKGLVAALSESILGFGASSINSLENSSRNLPVIVMGTSGQR
jgi:hypothetical protein